MAAFTVTSASGVVLLETDDWVDAQAAALPRRPLRPGGDLLRVHGTHPSHSWGPPREGQGTRDRRCESCGAWDNGSYGSQAPCGYTWDVSLAEAVGRELAARTGVPGATGA